MKKFVTIVDSIELSTSLWWLRNLPWLHLAAQKEGSSLRNKSAAIYNDKWRHFYIFRNRTKWENVDIWYARWVTMAVNPITLIAPNLSLLRILTLPTVEHKLWKFTIPLHIVYLWPYPYQFYHSSIQLIPKWCNDLVKQISILLI